MKKPKHLIRANMSIAEAMWGPLENVARRGLRELLESYRLSVSFGDLLYLSGKWYVTHAGLLRLAERRRCAGIRVSQVRSFCDPSTARWVFKATVYKTPDSKGFVGYGDADPSNVSSMVHGAEMRVAETRAVNRALRKAYGIGLCSVEELGWTPKQPPTTSSNRADHCPPAGNGSSNGQPRLRDRFCLLIRQHQLDSDLVKAYAAAYCDVATVREASREQIEQFINHLAERAAKDREGLLCQLNSYRKMREVTQ